MVKKKPNFFLAGAGKSGTSSLHELLNHHPDISMSTVKEPHYWTNPNFENFTEKDNTAYSSLFNDDYNKKYLGESSTGYMLFPNFIERIKTHYEDAPKLIFILRNPITRCYSHYWWLKGIGSESKDGRRAFWKDCDIEPSHLTRLKE